MMSFPKSRRSFLIILHNEIGLLEEWAQVEKEFQGKIAVVTGGGMGIGFMAASRLARGGAQVVVCDYNESQATANIQALKRSEGLDLLFYKADVRNSEQIKQLMAFTAETCGGIDILVNSAGVQRYGNVVETTEETWDEVLGINLKGMFLTCKYAIPEMVKRGGGAIVNVSSVQAFASQTGVAAYTASKGGVNAMTRAIALDHAREGIRVNAVCPGSVDTPMLQWAADLFKGQHSQERMVQSWGKMHPMGRVAKASEVAELIAFLASDRASFITGAEYKIDGGMLAAIGVQLTE
jgi:NAD(P)-dependent dehydrogenase (short-subunit alcohol dehydrogenase family)